MENEENNNIQKNYLREDITFINIFKNNKNKQNGNN